ncbi:hypothetical protein SBA3_1320002 [Candidatus Sulfopaludibacter sp. SbA3]|nr:hypothetical protein SBA3_1320002 [Candidatus Sulfopaludibacter sp. SbA3]
MAIPEDLAEQPRPERFARMYGNDSAPAIFMTKKVMAATDANNLETVLRQCSDQVGAGNPWGPAHAAIVMR